MRTSDGTYSRRARDTESQDSVLEVTIDCSIRQRIAWFAWTIRPASSSLVGGARAQSAGHRQSRRDDGGAADTRFGFRLRGVGEAAGRRLRAPGRRRSTRGSTHIMPQVASMGAAVAVADFDRDGWQDFYVTNSGEGSLNRLYRNQGDGTFTDVAAQMGVADVNQRDTGVSMGAVWGDYDNDGWDDLFLYRYGRPELFHNEQRPALRRRRRAGRPAALGQRQQRDLARLRPRRPARSVHRRLLGRRRQSLEARDDEDHAGELRVRDQRRAQVSAAQPRRRHVRGRDRGARHHAAGAGRWPSIAADLLGHRLSGPVPGQRLRRVRAVRQSRRQALRGRRRRRPASGARRRAA